jgi:drug/metabolite transporter (DMT)-like permease
VAVGAALLHEPLTWSFVAGAALVLVAAALANGLFPRPKPGAATAPTS